MSDKKPVFSFQAFKKKLTRRFARFTARPKPEPDSAPASPVNHNPRVNHLPDPLAPSRKYWNDRRGFVTRSQPNLVISDTDSSQASDNEVFTDDEHGYTNSLNIIPSPLSAFNTFRSGSQHSLLSGYQSSVQSIAEESDDDVREPETPEKELPGIVLEPPGVPGDLEPPGESSSAVRPNTLTLFKPIAPPVQNEPKLDNDLKAARPVPLSGEGIQWEDFLHYKRRLRKLKRGPNMMSGWSSLSGYLTYKSGGGKSCFHQLVKGRVLFSAAYNIMCYPNNKNVLCHF